MDDLAHLLPEDNTSPSRVTTVIIIILVGLVGLCVMAIAFFGLGPMLAQPDIPQPSHARDAGDLLNPPSQSSGSALLSKDELESVVASLQGQIELPDDKTVRAYRITDISQFAQSPFFAQAEQGDIVLTFEPSQTVWLYSSRLARVINQGQTK